MSAAGIRVPGPRISSASRRRCRSSPKSTPIASLKSTSNRPTVAMTWSVGDSSDRSTSPSPAGPSTAPTSRKIATWGSPVRSTAPERSAETRITMPTRASVAANCSWLIGLKYAPALAAGASRVLTSGHP